MAASRSDFGANPHAGAQRNNAASRGWGPGWPNCQHTRLGVAETGGVRVSVRRELVEVVETLLAATAKTGYRLRAGQCWGFACRPIRGTSSPSNHSWGLAVDLNSLANPFGTRFVTDLPPAVVRMWEAAGFYWGGRYMNRPDAMHFEYLGRPSNVAASLTAAKAALARLTKDDDSPTAKATDAAIEWEKRENAKPGSRAVRPGSVGDDVAMLQRFLGVKPANGRFGERTEAAVKRYQRLRGIPQSGHCGPKTWSPILRDLGIDE